MGYLANLIGRHPARLGLVMVALLIGGVAIGMALQSSLSTDATASSKGEAEVRIAATPRADGSVRVGLQQSGGDGTWTATEYPQLSVVPADAEPNKTLFSSAVTLATADVTTLADVYYEQGVGAGYWALSQNPDLSLWCLLHEGSNNERNEAHCQGFIDVLGADLVEVIRYTDLLPTFGAMQARIGSGDEPDYIAASEITELFGLLRITDARIFFPREMIDPEPPAGDRYCVIGHGRNSFWILLDGSVSVSASHLGVDASLQIALTAEERAAQIRECVDEGAAAIAVTLAETEVVAEAIQEARAQGVPVVTYNSGGSAAAASGSLLHIGLDDRQSGVVIGERLTAEGVTGPALCLIHEAENVGLTERCEGFNDSYDEVETLSVVGGFDPLVERLAVGDVGAVLALNAEDAGAIVSILERSEHSPVLAVVGFDADMVSLVLSGRVPFVVWDHGILQGYLAVSMAALAEKAFLMPELILSGAEITIQPSVYTSEDLRHLLPGG